MKKEIKKKETKVKEITKAKEEVKVTEPIVCSVCNGFGRTGPKTSCEACNGSGKTIKK